MSILAAGAEDAAGARRDRAAAVARFDRWAPTYEHSLLQSVYHTAHMATVAAARASSRPITRILDVGCGTGRFIRLCQASFPSADAIGLDLCRSMITLASDAAPAASFVQAAVEELPFRGSSFDLVVSTFSARHWLDPALGFTELARVLQPNGLLVVADATPADGGTSGKSNSRMWHDILRRAGLKCSTHHQVGGFGPVQLITVITASASCPRRRWHRHLGHTDRT